MINHAVAWNFPRRKFDFSSSTSIVGEFEISKGSDRKENLNF